MRYTAKKFINLQTDGDKRGLEIEPLKLCFKDLYILKNFIFESEQNELVITFVACFQWRGQASISV
jgi:hypothetical protein